MNKGGSLRLGDLRVTMTDARHSSGYLDDDGRMVYMGEAAGYVVELEDGMTIYFAGDTSLFSDMKLVGELYKPSIAFLPIGDRFTMDPRQAGDGVCAARRGPVVPMHWVRTPAHRNAGGAESARGAARRPRARAQAGRHY